MALLESVGNFWSIPREDSGRDQINKNFLMKLYERTFKAILEVIPGEIHGNLEKFLKKLLEFIDFILVKISQEIR